VLLSIQGGSDLGLFEINEAARLVHEAAHPEANIIFGAVIDDALGDEVRVTVIAAGFDGGAPQTRKDARGLGQVTGSAAAPAASTAPVAPAQPAPLAAVPTTTGVHALARPVVPLDSGFDGPESAPVNPAAAYQAQQPAQQPVQQQQAPAQQPAQQQYQQSGPVPAFLSTDPDAVTRTGQLEVPRIFDEEPQRRRVEELDIPDFLK
jgi:cell division protein FtsZ